MNAVNCRPKKSKKKSEIPAMLALWIIFGLPKGVSQTKGLLHLLKRIFKGHSQHAGDPECHGNGGALGSCGHL